MASSSMAGWGSHRIIHGSPVGLSTSRRKPAEIGPSAEVTVAVARLESIQPVVHHVEKCARVALNRRGRRRRLRRSASHPRGWRTRRLGSARLAAIRARNSGGNSSSSSKGTRWKVPSDVHRPEIGGGPRRAGGVSPCLRHRTRRPTAGLWRVHSWFTKSTSGVSNAAPPLPHASTQATVTQTWQS